MKKIKIDIVDVIIFLICIGIFLIAWMGFAPAIMTSDNWDQVSQVYTQQYSSGHPIFHTFIIGNIAKIFHTVGATAIFQILVFSLTWTWGCHVLRKYNNAKINKILQIIITVIICILPINFLYSVTLWKDVLFTYAILGSLICIYIGIKEKFSFTIGEIIIIAISSICIIKLRYNGVPIGFIILIAFVILNYIYNKKIKYTLVFISSFIVLYIITSIPGWVYLKNNSVQTGSGQIIGTKIYCIGALLNTDIEITDEEREFLNQILDVNEWKEQFNQFYGTPILFNPNKDQSILETEEGMKKFDEIFYKYAKQNPKCIIKHMLLVNSIWWSVPEYVETSTIVLNNDAVDNYEYYKNYNFQTKPVSDKLNHVLTRYIKFTLQNKIVYILIYRVALSIIISFILLIYIAIKKKNIRYLYIEIPMLLNIGTYVLFISSQDLRYFYPSFITSYFTVLVFFTEIINEKSIKKLGKEKGKQNE